MNPRQGLSELIKRLFPNNRLLFYIFLLFSCVIIAGYIVPTIIYQAPTGTDVYSHMYHTQTMFESDSFDEFYQKSFGEESLNFDYPFGLWLFGSIIMKMTGFDIFSVIYILPFFLMIILFLIYYLYANEMLHSPIKSMLSLLFLISMPIVAIGILNYSTSKFVSFIIVGILFIHIFRFNMRNYFISLALIFILAFSHTGTYMFIIFFAIIYFFVYIIICKKLDVGMYILVASLFFVYIFTMHLFPFIQPQYIDKGRMMLQIGDKFTEIFGFSFFSEWSNVFYENVFVSNNYIYAIFWSSLIFTIGILLLSIMRRPWVKEQYIHASAIFSNISHSIVFTPFWIGPIHTIFTFVGFFKLNNKGKCILFALILSALLPGALQSSDGTGSLREIYYLFLIIPITATLGFCEFVPRLDKFSSGIFKKALSIAVYLIIFIPLITAPIIGSFYFQPDIRGNINEIDNLKWLSTIGKPTEGVAPFAYKERIDFYANKKTTSFHQGMEMKQYLIDLKSVYLLPNAWKAMDNLYSSNIHYLIVSNRIFKGFDIGQNQLKIDDNLRLDKIFSSNNNFSFYKYTSDEKPHETSHIKNKIEYSESQVLLTDAGSSYLFENIFYKVKIDKYSPKITYIGTKTENFLEEGNILDYIKLSWTHSTELSQNEFLLEDIRFETIILDGNKIQYKGILKDSNSNQSWASIIITYTIYEKVLKREIKIVNDRNLSRDDTNLKVYFVSSVFAPISKLLIIDPLDNLFERNIFPSQDTITLRDRKVKSIFLPRGKGGLRLTYLDSIPYPNKVLYRGSTIYDYAEVKIPLEFYLIPSEPLEIIQFFSIGDSDTTLRNIKSRSNIKILNYPDGISPMILGNILQSTQSNDINLSVLQNINFAFEEFPEISLGDEAVNVNIFRNRQYYDYGSQLEQLSKYNTQNSGLIFTNFKFNLDTIRVLTGTSFKYILGIPIPPPEEGYYEEGVRNPKFSYLQGNMTNILMFPVSLPTSAPLRSRYVFEDLVAQWKATIDSAYNNDGIIVFLWDKNDIAAFSSPDEINQLILYAKAKGIKFTTLNSVSEYQHITKNIYLIVNQDTDSTTITIINPDQVSVNGFAFKIDLPIITDENSYLVQNGAILRTIRKGEVLTLYISTDLGNSQDEVVTIEPRDPKKILGLDFNSLYQGWNEFQVRDENGKGLPGVIIQVNERTYISDHQGRITLYLRRGTYDIVVTKPGYKPRTIRITTKGKIFKYFPI